MKRSTDVARHLAWAVAALLLLPGVGRAAGLGDGGSCQREQAAQQRGAQPPGTPKPGEKGQDHPPRPKWWIDAKPRAELGITDQQSAALEAIWQKGLPKRNESREQQDKLEATLSRMILNAVDEATFVAQLDKVEAARSESSKARFLMLYRMNRILKPDQRVKLDAMARAMREQRDEGRRGGSPSR
jgi:Spy/CpxP family protein refolding chaperone